MQHHRFPLPDCISTVKLIALMCTSRAWPKNSSSMNIHSQLLTDSLYLLLIYHLPTSGCCEGSSHAGWHCRQAVPGEGTLCWLTLLLCGGRKHPWRKVVKAISDGASPLGASLQNCPALGRFAHRS